MQSQGTVQLPRMTYLFNVVLTSNLEFITDNSDTCNRHGLAFMLSLPLIRRTSLYRSKVNNLRDSFYQIILNRNGDFLMS